ncbi:sulfated surface glycoprotein 185-like [Micropterus dolomieu]|uniref:sulfated surface glycoprotein 185-like n=1 Tax=Micropterus dolomieu TaxID=147949 RepID=UPI001E8DAE98|nr:sulfated surface glycoprotein 185-like [Micropterus dolomieu]XP_045930788.1 sulfated surface glycoprotein 185-like [Micropterus dolomieu]
MSGRLLDQWLKRESLPSHGWGTLYRHGLIASSTILLLGETTAFRCPALGSFPLLYVLLIPGLQALQRLDPCLSCLLPGPLEPLAPQLVPPDPRPACAASPQLFPPAPWPASAASPRPDPRPASAASPPPVPPDPRPASTASLQPALPDPRPASRPPDSWPASQHASSLFPGLLGLQRLATSPFCLPQHLTPLGREIHLLISLSPGRQTTLTINICLRGLAWLSSQGSVVVIGDVAITVPVNIIQPFVQSLHIPAQLHPSWPTRKRPFCLVPLGWFRFWPTTRW